MDFEPGLVSISGPNGSGKSNILDAVIFALGENRPKVMRADKLRSLIHDIEGAGRHGPKMTRVSVHLDNSDRKIPVDSNTVTITREMDDKGENIYYLNQKKDKREHVLDLLEVANAGLNQLNAVQQGTVTRISEFSPEEKRQAIEDLIGLSFFDEKKLESENQLVESDRKLEIALAKMDEIKKRIDELEVERNRKLRHDALDREISRLRAISAAKDLKTIRTSKLSQERNLHAISSEIKKFEEERSSIRKEIHELNSQKSKFMEEVNAYNQAKSSIDSQISEALQKSEGANSKIITSKRRLGQIDTRLPQIKTDLEQLGQERSELEPKIEQLRQAIHTAKESQRSISEQVRIVDSELSGVLKEQSKISTRKIEADIKVRSLVERLNSAKLALFRLESEHKDIQGKFDKNTINIQNFKSEQSKMSGLAERLDVVISNHKATITELKSRISQLGTKRVKGEQDVDDLALILEKASKAAAQYETQIRTIKGIMHEDYSIAQLKEDANKLGIEGLVYEMFSWDENHERAILAVGSDWLKAVIVKDFATLISLAEVIRTRRLPRLKILPIDAIPPLRPSVPDDHEVIGILSDYIRCDDKFSAIRTFLFGNVLLVQSREAAHRLSEQGYKTVTIHGEYFEAKANAVVLDINSKISKITKIISLSSSIEGLSQSIHLLKKYLQKRKGSLKNIEDRLQDYKNRFAISDTGLTNATTQYSDLKARISQIVEFQNNCIRRNSQLERRKEHLLAESAKQKSYIGSLEERISIVQDNYADTGQSRVASDIERLNERKLTLMPQQTELVNMLREKESDLASLSAAEEAAKSKTKILHEDNSILTKEKHEHEVSLRTLEKEKESSDAQLVSLREKEQVLISTSGTSVSQLKNFDDKLDDLNEKERTVSKEINTRERQSDSINRDLKDLVESETKL
ncbi:MAG: chromosome segregation SMC family protein, partial [Thermoproteota archaeon]